MMEALTLFASMAVGMLTIGTIAAVFADRHDRKRGKR